MNIEKDGKRFCVEFDPMLFTDIEFSKDGISGRYDLGILKTKYPYEFENSIDLYIHARMTLDAIYPNGFLGIIENTKKSDKTKISYVDAKLSFTISETERFACVALRQVCERFSPETHSKTLSHNSTHTECPPLKYLPITTSKEICK